MLDKNLTKTFQEIQGKILGNSEENFRKFCLKEKR